MAARIIALADVRAEKAGHLSSPQMDHAAHAAAPSFERFHFWSGASGEAYVHTVYALIDCPAIPASNYILVRRDTNGACHALAVGRVAEDAPSLNLARVRQLAANLGANEVHVHLIAGTPKQSKLVEFDLKSSLFTMPGGDAPNALRH